MSVSRGAAGAILTAALFAAACGESAREPLRPNVVLIVADDYGAGDHGFMGSEWVQTPELDRLAAEGVVFRTGYTTASVCRPSLNTLLTGLQPYQWQMRMERLARMRPGFDDATAIERFATLPRMLAEAGYASYQAGKHWEGSRASAGFSAGATEAYDPENPWGGAQVEMGRMPMRPVFDFIDAHRDGPFLLWFAPPLPHVPHRPPEHLLELYRGAPISDDARRYYASCTLFDSIVGELVRHLERRGLRDETLLVYLSDNGWDQPPTVEHAGPLEALLGGAHGKGSVYDRGFRTPILWSWPGRIPAGRVYDDLVSTIDVLPTLLDYAGVEPPEPLPGRSLRSRIEGHAPPREGEILGSLPEVRPEEDVLEMQEEDTFFVRTPRWHYILREDRGTEELYDVISDPEEQRDVAPERVELTAELRARIERWRAEVEAEAEAWVPLPAQGASSEE